MLLTWQPLLHTPGHLYQHVHVKGKLATDKIQGHGSFLAAMFWQNWQLSHALGNLFKLS